MTDIQKLRKRIQKLEAGQALLAEQLKGPGLMSTVRKGLSAKYIQGANALTGARIRLERVELLEKTRG